MMLKFHTDGVETETVHDDDDDDEKEYSILLLLCISLLGLLVY